MIRTIILISFVTIALIGCTSNNQIQNNPYLLPPSFSIAIDTNLPSYNSLKNVGSSVYVSEAGIKGMYVSNTGGGFVAFEATCPNHVIKTCSRITNKNNGVTAKCSCEGYEYNLLTGVFLSKNVPKTIYGLLPYSVSSSESSSVIRISN